METLVAQLMRIFSAFCTACVDYRLPTEEHLEPSSRASNNNTRVIRSMSPPNIPQAP